MIAGLPMTRACVWVGPPLLASGAIPGSVLLRSPVPVRPQLVPTSILCPPDVNIVGSKVKFMQISLAGSCSKMVYLKVASPRLTKPPPPCVAMLLLMVTLTSVALPLLCCIPAPESALLLDIVTLVRLTSKSLSSPPPPVAELPLSVTRVRVAVPPL